MIAYEKFSPYNCSNYLVRINTEADRLSKKSSVINSVTATYWCRINIEADRLSTKVISNIVTAN